MAKWKNIKSAPKNGKAFLITTAGPQIDMCWYDKASGCFRDYYHKQVIPQEWPYMVAWRKLPKPADVMAFKPKSVTAT